MCQYCDSDDLLLKGDHREPDAWRPHESPFIRDLIERWTSKGLDTLGSLSAELAGWLEHEFHAGGQMPPHPGDMYRWTPGELAAARVYLQAVPPSLFTLDDWMLVVEYLFQKYLPGDVVVHEADWLTAKAHMMGRAQATLGAITATAARAVVQAVPYGKAAIRNAFGVTPAQEAALVFGQARCAEYVVALSDRMRSRIRQEIITWQADLYAGTPSAVAKSDLQARLLDVFGEANRDWRRIALTEAGENANQGFLASIPVGSMVKRLEMYDGACTFCRDLDGRVFTVVPAGKKDKDGETEVWVGKTNIGRSNAPNKRTPFGLVPRLSSERWWPAAGVQHPHCRGTWVPVTDAHRGADPKFTAWLQAHFKKVTT